jgi:uncharacterized protein YlxW (UPF0749 family)
LRPSKEPLVISVATFAFALALVAVVNVALVWTTYVRLTQELESVRSTTQKDLWNFGAKLAELQKHAPTTLAAEVGELSEAVAKLRDIQRRFAGRFDAYVHHEGAKPVNETPDEVRQRLRAEHALPKIGGKS